MRLHGAMVAALLLLTACSSDEPETPEVGDVTASSAAATPDESPTTNSPASDASRTTTSAPSATRSATPTTDDIPEETTTTPPVQTESAPPTAPTEAALPPAPDPCSAQAMSSDLGYDEPVEIFECESGWAYATYIGGTGDTEFIAQRVDGVWVRVMGMGSPTCQDELLDMGAPPSVVVDVTPCDVMYPPDQPPPADNPPTSDCTVQTEIFGTAYADLVQVGCDDARAVWAAAATGHPGSWDELVPAYGGWECTVVPYEPYPPIAGACFGPGVDGEQFFVLNL